MRFALRLVISVITLGFFLTAADLENLNKILQLAEDLAREKSCLCHCNSSSSISSLTTEDRQQILRTISRLSTVLDKLEPAAVKRVPKRPRRSLFRRKLVLPPGTTLVLTPTLALPLMRHPPIGFNSNLTISFPLTISFDNLGLTDNANPFGTFPEFTGIFSYLLGINSFESREDEGGHRLPFYRTVEDILINLGLDGKHCVLRTICELHEYPLTNYGLFGEVLELIFTATKSSDSSILLSEYAEAEKSGRNLAGCQKYYEKCPKSLFGLHNDDINQVETDDTEEIK